MLHAEGLSSRSICSSWLTLHYQTGHFQLLVVAALSMMSILYEEIRHLRITAVPPCKPKCFRFWLMPRTAPFAWTIRCQPAMGSARVLSRDPDTPQYIPSLIQARSQSPASCIVVVPDQLNDPLIREEIYTPSGVNFRNPFKTPVATADLGRILSSRHGLCDICQAKHVLHSTAQIIDGSSVIVRYKAFPCGGQ